MKKKIMAVTLCLAMVSTFAVGCGQKNETDSGKSEEKSSGKVEIEFVQVKREAAESYTKVIEAFEKENPDIVIKQNVVPDAQEVLMTRASSDSLPDMMNHWPTDAQFVQFEDEGLLLDLSEKDYMKNIDSKYLDAVKAKDGKNYIAPYNVNFMGVYYNKDKFEEAGYTMPTKWDELIALAEEIKAKGETPFILPNKDSWTVSNLWSNIEARDLGSHEDEFEKMKAGEESFETIPEYKSGVEKMIQLLDYANEDSLALGYDQAINDFANGEGWMFLQGSWTLPSFLSANPDFNVEFTILPNDNGKPIATQAVSNFTAEQIKEAEQYIQIDVQQPLYSMVDRGFEDLMSWGYDRGIDSMTYGSMGAGILSGKIRSVPSFEKNDLRLNFYDVYKEPKFSKIMELLKVMDSIADGHNVPVGQVALNWSTQKEYVGTALVGVRSIEHADENCKTFDWKLTEEEMKILDSKIEECAL